MHNRDPDLFSLNPFTTEQYPCMSSLLPELHHCAGEVSVVCDAVVGVTAVCVPGIATTLPWQLLKIKEKKREKSHRQLFLLGPLSHRRVPFSLAVEQPRP